MTLQGNAYRTTVKIKDISGNPVDPQSLLIKYRVGEKGTITTKTFGEDAEVVKDEVGAYHIDIVFDKAGKWVWRWESTNPTAAVEGEMEVVPSKL